MEPLSETVQRTMSAIVLEVMFHGPRHAPAFDAQDDYATGVPVRPDTTQFHVTHGPSCVEDSMPADTNAS